jgi:hypothetical protein
MGSKWTQSSVKDLALGGELDVRRHILVVGPDSEGSRCEARVAWSQGLTASRFGGAGVGVGRSWSGRCCSATVVRSDWCRRSTGSGACPLASGFPSLCQWLLDPMAGGRCGGWFVGCRIPLLLGADARSVI